MARARFRRGERAASGGNGGGRHGEGLYRVGRGRERPDEVGNRGAGRFGAIDVGGGLGGCFGSGLSGANREGETGRGKSGGKEASFKGYILESFWGRDNCESEKEVQKLERMLADHRTALYPGCEKGYKKLSTILEFLQWKAKNGVSDKAFGELLKLVKNILLEGNELPESTYEAKKTVCPLGLEVQKIHACPNDCMLYCEERKQDGMLRHSADGSQWRNIDRTFKDFGEDAQNRKYIMMPIIIQGPKQPGNDIDVYLRPLVEDLKVLWRKEGVPVWDEDKQEQFNL
uniref:OSJNBa0011E07.11 protein n=1 Tax=Oryza sativa subsp. japonica TaxID=39947 RepID=Q7FA97_ORYSJ|nr:OSJNBa0011E07.11 [Oryza sativa Japonica Group]